MSRIAKAPVELPPGVTATIAAERGDHQGREGLAEPAARRAACPWREGEEARDASSRDRRLARTRAGATRAHLANMVRGVTKGYEKKLELVGVGFRAAVQGKTLNLTLGFSHPVDVPIPGGHQIETPSQTEILVKGIDRQKVGQVAAEIRDIRPPEPYKGKGVRYADEQITLKEGKKKRSMKHQEGAAPAPRHQDARAHPRAGRRAPHRASHAQPYLRAGRPPRRGAR